MAHRRHSREGRAEAKILKRILIVERGEKCELCGATKNIQIHHRNHDRRVNTKENGQLLCDSCHKHHHKIFTFQTDYSRPLNSKGA
jgi:hypothetical protein